MNKKHILIITSVYPRNPTDRYGCFIQEFIKQLQASDTGNTKFTVFAPAYKGLTNHFDEGIKVYRFRYCLKQFEILTHGEGAGTEATRAPTKVQKNPGYILLAAFYIISGSWQLFWLCLKLKPDLINTHWPFPHGLMAWPTSKFLNIPLVFSCHGAELMLGKKFGFVTKTLRFLFSEAKGITANSSFTKNLIQAVRNCPVTVIPYGLTIETKPAKEHSPEQLPTILCVGNMYERKGMKYLIDALPIVLEKHAVKLRIIGKGEQEQSLKNQVKVLGIEQEVEFLGFVSNEVLSSEYASCDIFVLPSIIDRQGDTEGQGIPVVEALAHGKPVVASAVGGIVDAIESGKTGLLVPEKDPQALADALISLLNNPKAAREMGRLGQQDIHKRYSWDRLGQLWQDVYQKALLSAN
ncbi:MAG: glycosyltransferase family 4 protein [Sphaerospermopsis sp. SIO1G2]|nr:glycosyltransferase family 4 protein [Sphaerospermopsis sp. SIO1G2]